MVSGYDAYDVNLETGFAHSANWEDYPLLELNSIIPKVCVENILYDPNRVIDEKWTKESTLQLRNAFDDLETRRDDVCTRLEAFYNDLSNHAKKLTYSMSTFMVQKYLRGSFPEKNFLPSVLYFLWEISAREFKINTAPTYAAVVLWNWRRSPSRQDDAEPIDSVNILFTVTGLPQEAFFYKTHVAIELEGAILLKCMFDLENHIVSKESMVLMLRSVERTLTKIKTLILDMKSNGCDPANFWTRVRPVISGYEDTGLVVLNTANVLYHKGGSGAQSCIFQSVDALLGVTHTDHEAAGFLTSQVHFIPDKHNQCVAHFQKSKSLRVILEDPRFASDDEVSKAYDEALWALRNFRIAHEQTICRYIIQFSMTAKVTKFLSQLLLPLPAKLFTEFLCLVCPSRLMKASTARGSGGLNVRWLPHYVNDVLRKMKGHHYGPSLFRWIVIFLAIVVAYGVLRNTH